MRNTQVPQELDDKYSRAVSRIFITPDNAFFASIVLNTEMYWNESVGTAATNGTSVIYAPSFVEKLSVEQLMGLILHECMHIVYAHVIRRGNRDPRIWNVAADHVINTDLKSRKYQLPEGGCCDMKYLGWDTEAVYDDIYEEEKAKQDKGQGTPHMSDLLEPDSDPSDGQGNKQKQQQGNGSSAGQGDEDGGEIPQPSPEEIEAHVKEVLVQAVQTAHLRKQAGSIPGQIERALDKLLKPILPWKTLLAKFLFSMNKADYSWSRPNRRYINQGIILPSLHGESLGQIDFAIDTSGSVSEADFNRFISEIAFVFERFKPDGVGVAQFDHILQATDKVANLSEFKKIQFKGGGGTNIKPVLDWFKNTSKGKALFVLTDGYFSHSKDLDPKKPVVWLIYGNPTWQPPFGKAIYFEN